jgi:hypothetical protein
MKTLITIAASTLLAAASLGQTAIFQADPASTVAASADDTRALLASDLDGDGDLDVLVGNYAQANQLLENRGDGVFESVPADVLTTPLENTYGATSGDIDGDGDLDLALANGGGANNSLFRNNGPPGAPWAGRFTDLSPDPVTQDGGVSHQALFVDVDGDGDQDLLFANKDVANFLYRNNGFGSFTGDTLGAVVTDSAHSRGAASGDLDGDGDQDLVFANSNDESNFVYINQGGFQGGLEGDFSALAADPSVTPTDKSYGVDLADWDNDGDLDMFVSNRKDQNNALFQNDGSGSFSLAAGAAPTLDTGDSFSGTFGDADGDGDVDLFVANRLQANFLYVNDGSNLVKRTSGPVIANAGDSRLGIFADINSDGTAELAVGNTNGQANELYRNAMSHWVDLGSGLSVPGGHDPRMSAAGDLSSHSWVRYFVDDGAAAASATLVVGLNEINAPFRGGVLVPSPDLLVPGLTTDAEGFVTMSFIVPGTLPSGLDIFHQVWVVDGSAPNGLIATNGLQGTTP